MARRRIRVDKIKEVVRYGVTTELSERAIGRALKVSRTAVTKYLECFRGSGLTWEQAQELPDSELLAVLEGSRPARTSARYERLAERFPMMVKELRRKGVTLQLLWEEYLRAHPDGYQNSQFCHHFHFWRKSAEVSMHIDHKAGEKLFVDYAGDQLAIVDPKRGKEQPVETFVAILGASELTYVEASATQQSEDWIRSNERALRYCGGGTQVIVPDNLRSAVSRSDPYEPGINATFDAFAQHYGVVIMPARVRQARDKALVESAVRLTYQRIYAPLRDRTFHSLEELNAAIMPLLEQHNGRRFQRLPYSRRELFEQIEQHTLAPLPAYHFPLQQTREVTVQFNYHVELRADRHHYSVPWQLRTRDPRTKVKLLYDERTVSIYYDNVRLAEYQRDRRPGGYTTLPDSNCSHAAAAPVVCRVEPRTIHALGAGARRQRRGGDRAGAQGRQVPAAGVPFLPGYPEPGEELRRSAARSRLPAGIVLPTVLLPPHSEHAETGLGGGARAAAAELPQP